MTWWNILKNSKISGRSKSKSFDASKVKITIDKNDCKEKLTNLLESGLRMHKEKNLSQYNLNSFFDKTWFSTMPEDIACKILTTLKNKFPPKSPKFRVKVFEVFGKYPNSYYIVLEEYEEEISIMFKQEYKNWATLNFITNEDYAKWLALA